MMFLSRRALTHPASSSFLLLIAAVFVTGLTVGAAVGPRAPGQAVSALPSPPQPPRRAALRGGYPAELITVIDGDTFEARVRVWLGTDVTTRIRIRGIDAPELKTRCEDERIRALAAKDALAAMLAQGGIALTNVGQDKYGGRVDADVATRDVASVADAMLEQGLARRYGGGRRAGWCD